MRRLASAVAVLFVIISAGMAFAGYPYEDYCPNGEKVFSRDYYNTADKYWVDIWRFGECECTSYVAWKLNDFIGRSNSDPAFFNSYYINRWGNAYGWKSPVDDEVFAHFSRMPEHFPESERSYPYKPYNGGVFDVRAAVAWWDKGSGTLNNGHVAFVDSISWNRDKTVSSITISEYNWNNPHEFGRRTLRPGDSGYPDGFLYIVTDTLVECADTDLCNKTGGIGGGGGDTADYPNLKVHSVGVFTLDGHEKNEQESFLNIGETYEVRVYPISEEEDCTNGVDSDIENVETDIYYKISDEDSDGKWVFLKRVYTRPSTLTKGNTNKETAYFKIPAEAANKRMYFKAKVDANSRVHETNDDDNESYWQKEWYPVAGNYDFIISYAQINGGRSSLNEGDRYGFEMGIKNVGTDRPPVGIRSAYYHQNPGSADTWELVATDGTDNYDLAPGLVKDEATHYQPFVASSPGVHKAKICADYDGKVPEKDETNNCTVFSFGVDMHRPDFVISQFGLTGGRTSLKLGEQFGLRAVVANQGSVPATIDIRSAYYIKSPGESGWKYVQDDGTDANELCPGCFHEEATLNEPFLANAIGIWQAMACANYKHASEADSTNDCSTFSFEVKPVGPDFVISDMYIKVGSTVYREGSTIKRNSVVHPYAIVANIGTSSAHPGFRIAYYIDSDKFRDSDGLNSNEVCAGCSKTEYISNDGIRLGDKGARTYRCCADYKGTVPELDETNNCKTMIFYIK